MELEDVRDFFGMLAAVFMAMFFLGAIIVSVVFLMVNLDCRGYSRATGRPTKMVFATCYINQNGKWYSADERRSLYVN